LCARQESEDHDQSWNHHRQQDFAEWWLELGLERLDEYVNDRPRSDAQKRSEEQADFVAEFLSACVTAYPPLFTGWLPHWEPPLRFSSPALRSRQRPGFASAWAEHGRDKDVELG